MATGSIGAPLLAERAVRSYIEMVLEGIAIRQQIALLKRSGTRRPYFRLGESVVLDVALVALVGLAHEPDDCPAGNRLALATPGLVRVLAVPGVGTLAGWTSANLARIRLVDQARGPRELPLGRSAHPWRIVDARVQGLAGDRVALHAGSVQATGSIVADISVQPAGWVCRRP